MVFKKKAIIFNDTSYDYHLGCEIVIKNLKYLLEKNNITVIGTSKVGECWFENQELLKKIETADLLIVNGEGTIHSNNEKGVWLLKVSEYAKKRNKKSVLINSIFQNNNKSFKKYLDYFDIISVRESLSHNELKLINVNSEIVPDLTFYSQFSINDKIKKNVDILFGDCVNIDKANNNLKYSRQYLNSSYISILHNKIIISRSLKIMDILRLIKNKIKFNFNKFKFKYLNHYFINSYQYRYYGKNNIKQYLRKLVSSKIHISGRFHSICLSLISFTPFLAQSSNTFKIQGLLNDIGLRDRFIEDHQISLKLIEKNSFFEKSEKDKITEYSFNAKIKIDNLFNKIANL